MVVVMLNYSPKLSGEEKEAMPKQRGFVVCCHVLEFTARADRCQNIYMRLSLLTDVLAP